MTGKQGGDAARGRDVLGALLAAARRERQGGWRRHGPVAWMLAGAALLLVSLLGQVLYGDWMGAKVAVLEVSFWGTALASSLWSFQIMERLYRTGDARVLAPLPIAPRVLLRYRWWSTLRALPPWLVVALFFFAPLFFGSEWPSGVAALGLWSVGLLLTLCVGYAVQVYTGVASVRGEERITAFGPMGFAVAPAIALAVTVVLLLVLKLAVEEVVRLGSIGSGARFGFAVVFGAMGLSLWLTWRYFDGDFYGALARFMEMDLLVIASDEGRFRGVPLRPTLAERLLPEAMRPLVARDRLQMERRFGLARILLWLVAAGLLIGLVARPGALPTPLLLVLPALAVAIFVHPWLALRGSDLEPGVALVLPVTPGLGQRATAWSAVMASLVAARPLFGALGLGLAWGEKDWLGALVALSLSVLMVVTVAWCCSHPRWGGRRSQGAAAFFLALAAALVALHPLMSLPFCALAVALNQALGAAQGQKVGGLDG